ncbi:hypothetical protein ABID21_004099 [Pseudorhizobium tarimense]|uniref:Uncharacterized protein n=1 Tax=Pseudorhizobium tarimense TaxID=1079109 RepID=A0ABV2HBR5_9HYPH|nr:hypothetical protein [Pseudorhizobium tarimense]MCJ8521048.1 hypothetical protein [Pseudorhizobium tarimense]
MDEGVQAVADAMGSDILRYGKLQAAAVAGELRCLTFDGVEILRGLNALLRDENWGVVETEVVLEEAIGHSYRRRFRGKDAPVEGSFRVEMTDERELRAHFSLEAREAVFLNRAGFTLLHPIKGLAGSRLNLRHPGGGSTQTAFPLNVAAAQPAFNIAGMEHAIGALSVDVQFEGDVFEMEDQRNWSDASFKTYCRPLALPRPFVLERGQSVDQSIVIRISGEVAKVEASPRTEAERVRLPQVLLAHDAGSLPVSTAAPLLLRVFSETTEDDFARIEGLPVGGVEVVFDAISDLQATVSRLIEHYPQLDRLTALPRLYLKSYQPEGPWPEGPRPSDALPVLRRLLPGVALGGGSLTHFTEANRCAPASDADFITFGNSAIVHAADDCSVTQTLEALPDIFTSAAALLPAKPLHLGLFSIAMRSNPYGDGLAANPQGRYMTMTNADPRQETEYAAAYAAAVLALAAKAGCASIALAMTSGPLAAAGPLASFLQFAQQSAGAMADVIVEPDKWSLMTERGGYSVTADARGSLSLVYHFVEDASVDDGQ